MAFKLTRSSIPMGRTLTTTFSSRDTFYYQHTKSSLIYFIERFYCKLYNYSAQRNMVTCRKNLMNCARVSWNRHDCRSYNTNSNHPHFTANSSLHNTLFSSLSFRKNFFYSLCPRNNCVRKTSTLPEDIFIPSKFKKIFEKQAKLEQQEQKIVKPQVVAPMSVNKTEVHLKNHDYRLMKYIKLELNDMIQTEKLDYRIQSKIEIVHVELTPNRKKCIIWWRFYKWDEVKYDESTIADILDKYSILFSKMVALRMSYGVRVRKMPKFEFKFDKSGEITERALELFNRIEKETVEYEQKRSDEISKSKEK